MYRRDFRILTEEEAKIRDKYFLSLKNQGWKFVSNDDFKRLMEIHDQYPAIGYNLSLFPNNRIIQEYLDGCFENPNPQAILNSFISLIDNLETTERHVLNFIKNNFAYFIPASIAKDYANWGHHELYVFPEFPLGTNYKVDYLVLGNNSEGYHLMFVEFENPYDNITTKDGEFGVTLRKGLSQITDWQYWLEKNFSHLKSVFEKSKSDHYRLPDELFEYDSTRITLALVGGRRDDFSTKTYLLRRKHLQKDRTVILHYDNIINLAQSMIDSDGFGGANFLSRRGAANYYTGQE